ncbi:type I-E CRISPR-associated protein Cas5/CasD [Streptomyces scopuliridis]|uniref:Type I-E CRISPR-associated protein Cas5/CasD n=1 Tax=Streptomyces scopuliridis TaxID=452529 RepID=A0ACD4ZTK8_9ACTN|nr:type I-E CRISPR-associated protein Cas5/CasD [Streptomyces scopuliridis]WSC01519.1 type I-E CRISPR-associated protein Cas5/CasD [Streptomyces scopuliridis]WSC04944.1 type I-E CRISPR-associated protein Cas5/CasD [Streptomyces scopuliridis]
MNSHTAPAPLPGLLLRLSGPLQSWGERSHFNDRDTAPFPTRSGVIGLLSSALGRHRNTSPADLAHLSLTVRTDRPGVLLRDLHTVGGGLPPKATVSTAEGKKRSADTSTVITHRTYLADAAFTIAITTAATAGPNQTGEGANTALLDLCARALNTPQWPLYLGRRSCPPEGPLLLGRSNDALHHLIHLPLAAAGPHPRGVKFLSDRPLDQLPVPQELITPDSPDGAHPTSQANDEPVTFDPRRRTYRARPLYRRTLHLPHAQYTGLGTSHLASLQTYVTAHLGHPEESVQ